jgi:hypothetical protein
VGLVAVVILSVLARTVPAVERTRRMLLKTRALLETI